jgi:hypothetical protein
MTTPVKDPYARATTAEENQSVTTSDPTQATPANYPENPDQSNTPTNLSIQETRQALVSLYVRGDSNDARALFSAAAGATEAGWSNLERILTPVKDFVIMGNLPYVNVWSGEYSGVAVQRNEDMDQLEATRPGGSTGPVILPSTPATVQSETGSGEPVTETLPMQAPTNSAETSSQTPTQTGSSATGTVPAAELISRAQKAKTEKELDEIEELARERVTVLDAIDARRAELAGK